jgi:glycosyltransferase involved in cell wall biosynthesis
VNILWIPHTGWHIPQRAHLFCRALLAPAFSGAERHNVHVTDWVADFTRPADFFSRRYLRNFTYRRYFDPETPGAGGKITVHGVPRIAPALFFPFLRRLNTRLLSQLVARLIREYRIDVVIGSFLLPPPDAPRLVFDLFDDNVSYWRSFGKNPAYADEIEQTEQAYLQTADAVLAASHTLVDLAVRRQPRGAVHWLPNAVELRDYDQADPAKWRNRLGLTGKIVGVLGNHDKPAEMDKVIAVAQALAAENVRFVVAGRGSALAGARKQAGSLENVLFTGPIARSEVPHLLAALDVGWCPYLRTPGADAGSPMRLLQYAAAGLPTVCTDLREARRMAFDNVVLVADGVEAAADGLRRALHLPRQRPPQIADYDLPLLTARLETILHG